MAASSHMLPVREALEVAAVELTDLARLSGQIETIIANLVAHAGDVTPALLSDCQVADLLSQRLVGVASFLAALAKSAPADAAVDVFDAVRAITLTEQASRLSGRCSSVEPFLGDGELALFED